LEGLTHHQVCFNKQADDTAVVEPYHDEGDASDDAAVVSEHVTDDQQPAAETVTEH